MKVQHLVFDGSIDAMLAKTLAKKQKIISESIDAENLETLLGENNEGTAIS